MSTFSATPFSAKWFWMNLAPLSCRLTNAVVKIIAMDIDEIKLFDCSSTPKLLKFEKLSHRPLPRAFSVWGTKCKEQSLKQEKSRNGPGLNFQRPLKLKWKLVKKGFFLLFGLQLENEARYCDGKAVIHRATNDFWMKSACGPFLTVFCLPCPKLGDAGR